MERLPIDILNEVVSYIPNNKQSSVRLVSKRFAQLPLDLRRCDHEPTSNELIRWLWGQQQLLKYANTAKYSVFQLYNNHEEIRVSLEYNQYTHININVQNGSFKSVCIKGNFTYTLLNTLDDLIACVGQKTIHFSNYINHYDTINLSVVRDMLKLRTSYIIRGWDPDRCYLQLIAQHLTGLCISSGINMLGNYLQPYIYHTTLLGLFKPEAQKALIEWLNQKLGRHVYVSYNLLDIPNYWINSDSLLDIKQLQSALQAWICTRASPSDLADDPRMRLNEN